MRTSTVAAGPHQYELSVHVTGGARPTPALVYINQAGNAHIGCYVYTIGNGKNTYSSVLQQGSDTAVQDLATNLGRVLSTKLARPSYVCMSGHFSIYDYGELCVEVMREVNEAAGAAAGGAAAC